MDVYYQNGKKIKIMQLPPHRQKLSPKPCTRLDPQHRKIRGPGVMDLAPSSTRGPREIYVSFDWEYSPGAMILGPIEYKESVSIQEYEYTDNFYHKTGLTVIVRAISKFCP